MPEELDPLYVWTRKDFEKYREIPVDGYLIDVFLDEGDWGGTNAAELLKDYIKTAPRSAPVFLLSQQWDNEAILDILKQAGEASDKIVCFLSWNEFQRAAEEEAEEEDNAVPKHKMVALRKKLLFNLDIWHGRSGFRPGPNETIRILLIADTQFGDPTTDPKAVFAEHWIAHELRNSNMPDIVVIAGDISYSGRPDEFALAEERLTLDLIGQLWGNVTTQVSNFWRYLGVKAQRGKGAVAQRKIKMKCTD